MKKIEFGFANEQNPRGSWEGIGIKPGLLLNEADYYGVVNVNRDSYIVAKVTKDDNNRYPQLLDKFIVRQAIADIYPDGSGIIFLDQEQSNTASLLEEHLNNPEIKDRISSIEDVLKLSSGLALGARVFNLLTDGEKIITTSIKHEVFTKKNEALKYCHMSFSELFMAYQEQLQDNKKFSR